MRALAASALAAALALTPARANELPDLGDVSAATLSPAQERAIGWNAMRQIRASSAYLDDPEVNDYLSTLGYRLVAVSADARTQFTFFGIRDSSVNAFAMPGGYIGVHSGLLLTAQSESELASVLGHEVAHVTQKHLARMLAQQSRDSVWTLAALALAILAARSNGQAAMGAVMAAQAQALSNRLAFSRDNEREADRVGVSLLSKAGFDPHAMPVFLDRLQRASRLYENGAPTYLRSHPVTYERVADVQNRTFDLPYRQIPDSLEFHLVRAKLRAEQGDPRDAVAAFDEQLRERKFAAEAAARYGLVVALLRANDLKRAGREIDTILRAGIESGMQASLVGRFRIAQGDRAGALAWYTQQIKLWPQHRGMVYAYTSALIDAGRAADALDALDRAMLKDQEDGRLYELQAKAYLALGQPAQQHRSLAEASIAAGDLPLAIEHLRLALDSGSGDFYTLSSIEARLRELRALQPPATR